MKVRKYECEAEVVEAILCTKYTTNVCEIRNFLKESAEVEEIFSEIGGVKITFKGKSLLVEPGQFVIKHKNGEIEVKLPFQFDREYAVIKESISGKFVYRYADTEFEKEKFETKEEALEAAKQNADGRKIQLGIVREYTEHNNDYSREIIELMRNKAYERFKSESIRYMNINEHERELLSQKLNDAIAKFQFDFGHEPDFYYIDPINIQEEEC